MKAEVEYKLTKKMKKRRELDALVDTDKLPRARKSSISAQELLEYHSESSDTEDFSPPPLSLRNKKCCLCHHIVVRMGIFMLCVVSLTTCVGLLWVQWHIRQQITVLTKQVEAVQASSTSSSDVMTLKSQLANVNNSVNALKTKNITTLNQRISDAETMLSDLKTVTDRLQKSVADYQDLIDIPEKQKSMTQLIQDLNERVAALESTAKEESTKSVTQEDKNAESIAMLDKEIGTINGTFVAEMSKIHEAFQQFSTAGSEPALSATQIQSLVSGLLTEMMANYTRDTASLPGGGELQQLTQQISAVMDNITKLQKQAGGIVEGDYLAFKQSTQDDFQFVNSSLASLNSDMTSVSNQLAGMDRAVHNLTVRVASLQATPDNTNQKPEDAEASSTAQSPTEGQQSTTSQELETSPSPGSEEETTPVPSSSNLIMIDGEKKQIKDVQGLLTLLADLPQTKDGDFTAQTLLPFLASPASQLPSFDLDKNGNYSKEELRNALGFNQSTESPR